MKIAIASGKGGTGKTTVATSLAATLARRGQTVAYVDCDVEAPNGHLFLKPEITGEHAIHRKVPQVMHDKCIHCGECATFCRFNAIACLPRQTMIHEDLCEACGGCIRICPAGALVEKDHPMGVVKTGIAEGIRFVSGTLDVGEAKCPPLIRAAKQAAPMTNWTILDAPPGIACPMLETVRDCDFVVLVTEPTPFGLHDLRLAIEVAGALQRPFGVVVNRAQTGIEDARELCALEQVPILAEIPDGIEIARAYSRGRLVIDASPDLQPIFEQLIERLGGALKATACERSHSHD